MKTALPATLLVLLAGCGDPLFFAEVEDRNVCITLPSVSVPAAPLADTGEQNVAWTVDFDVGSSLPGLHEKGTTATIRMSTLKLASTGDLTSITGATVDLVDGTATGTRLMHYTQTPPVADPTTISMTLDQDPNLFDHLVDGKLSLRIGLSGRPPQAAWTAAVTSCVAATVKIDPMKSL